MTLAGDKVYATVLPVLVLRAGGGSEGLGLVMAAFAVPQVVLLPFAGALVERLPRWRVVLVSELLQGLAVATLLGAMLAGRASTLHIALVSSCLGACAAFGLPAGQAMIPEVVVAKDIQAANALMSIANDLSGLTGPVIGGLLIVAGDLAPALALDVVSFLVSAAAMLRLARRGHRLAPVQASEEPLRAQIVSGLRLVLRTKWLATGILVAAIVNFFYAAALEVGIPLVATNNLHTPASYGWLLTAAAGGSIAAGAALARAPKIRAPGVWAYGALTLLGATLAALSFTQTPALLGALGVPFGVALALYGIVWQTSLLQSVPADHLARVLSVEMSGSFAMQPLGYLFVGWLAAAAGARTALLIGGLAVLTTALVALASPATRAFTPVEKSPVGAS